MPSTLNDMKQHCKQSNYNNLNEIVGLMELNNINLFMPRFRYECTSRAEKALGKVCAYKQLKIYNIQNNIFLSSE